MNEPEVISDQYFINVSWLMIGSDWRENVFTREKKGEKNVKSQMKMGMFLIKKIKVDVAFDLFVTLEG